jgi:hypothetical protein
MFRMSRMIGAAFLIVTMFALTIPPAFAATLAVFSGNIASGPQFDLHTIPLEAGSQIIATLVCDEIAPGDRPLDPVLSVYFPGSDPSDVINADVFNDDGFGQDDFPEGVDCNAFDSSRVSFTAPVNGTYTFRADGFGSSTGPYTLTVIGGSASGGFNPGDDRINVEAQASFAVYCRAQGVEIWDISASSTGTRVINASSAQITDALVRATTSGVNVLIAEGAGNQFWALPSGELLVSGPGVNNPTHIYNFTFLPSRCGIAASVSPFVPPTSTPAPEVVYVEIRPGVYMLVTATPAP